MRAEKGITKMSSESSLPNDGDSASSANNPLSWVLIVVAVALIGINALLAMPTAGASNLGQTDVHTGLRIAFAATSAIMYPGIVVALFMIGERFRGSRAALRVFCGASLVLCLIGGYRAAASGSLLHNKLFSSEEEIHAIEHMSTSTTCGDARLADKKPYDLSAVTKPVPHPGYKLTVPGYPELSPAFHQKELVTVEIFVNESGDVAKTRLVTTSGNAELDEAVVMHALDWHVTPGRYQGQPTCSWMKVSLRSTRLQE
jgi:TonB family protein